MDYLFNSWTAVPMYREHSDISDLIIYNRPVVTIRLASFGSSYKTRLPKMVRISFAGNVSHCPFRSISAFKYLSYFYIVSKISLNKLIHCEVLIYFEMGYYT